MQDYTLAHGTHMTPDDGRCAMEWVSLLAGEPHSDAPRCVSPVVRGLCVALNDGLPDDRRQRLRPYLARTIGTAGDGLDEQRSWLALDWLIRTYTPAWLALAGLDGTARTLRGADPVTGSSALARVLPDLDTARRAARTSRGRVYGSARIAAAADGRAARTATWDGAGSAVWAAARIAISDPAAERAQTRLRRAAGDGAAVAIRRVADDGVCGRPAPAQAARTALRSTFDGLAASAIELLDTMLPTVTVDLGAVPRRPAATPAAR